MQNTADEDLRNLLRWCYPSIDQEHINQEEISSRAIVAPLNEDVNRLNNIALDMMIGDMITLKSADTVEENEGLLLPLEFINSLDVPGMPLHELQLKKGCPVILLRNLDPEKGLCNGTRLIVHAISPRVLTVYRSSDPEKN